VGIVNGKNIDLSGGVTTSDMLKDIIQADQSSKEKSEMVKGVNYYNSVNDILTNDPREYYVNGCKYIDHNKSNEHIVNNMQKKLTDQKVGYMASKPITMESDETDLVDKVSDLLGEEWHDIIQQWILGSANKGQEVLQPYIDSKGDFRYCIIPAEQMIFITDTTYQKEIVQSIRYYSIEWVKDDQIEESLRVEVWDEEKVTRFQEETDAFGNTVFNLIVPGTMGVGNNPEYHWYTYNTNCVDSSQLNSFSEVMPKGVEGNGWGKVPQVSYWNNQFKRSDLVPIKRYIDALDLVSSGFMNDLKDIQLAIWVLKGYEGTGLDEFMRNLQEYKAISLSTESGANAEPKTLEIPKEARMAIMEWLEGKIYEVGQGVDESKLAGGSLTNVAIQALYTGLELKANQSITKLKSSLSDFMYFVVKFINERDKTDYNYKSIKYTFNKSVIFNLKETVETIMLLVGEVSHRTRLANNPFVNDVDAELELLKQEKEQNATDIDNNMGFGDE